MIQNNDNQKTANAYLAEFKLFSDRRKRMIVNLQTDNNRMMFACSCCERLFERYTNFSKLSEVGDLALMTSTLDGLWDFIRGRKEFAGAEVDSCKERIQASVPNTEDLPESLRKEAYGATYFCSALKRCFEFLTDRSASRIFGVADDAFNAVEEDVRADLMSVNSEVDNGLLFVSNSLDQRVRDEAWKHESVQREIGKQISDLKFLEALTSVTDEIIVDFRTSALTT